jgi:hypothetical protein
VIAASAAALAILVGLVAPLALGSTSWQQRAALAVLVLAAAWPLRRKLARLGGRSAVALATVAVVVLVVTVPLALANERAAAVDQDRRTGERLRALNHLERAVAYLERGGANEEAAAIHLELAEDAVAAGLSAAAYASAAEHLNAALRLAPSPQAERLAEAVAAARQADIIWNDYDWPRTIAELHKAQSLRPDLPGLAEKVAAAEASFALARRSASP